MKKMSFALTLCGFTFFSCVSALALTPLPDQRKEFFAGEWVGLGPENQFCRVELKTDGSGTLQRHSPNGSWSRQSLKWRNVGQAVVVDEPKSLGTVANQMNGTFKLIFSGSEDFCQMQRRIDFEKNLNEALKTSL